MIPMISYIVIVSIGMMVGSVLTLCLSCTRKYLNRTAEEWYRMYEDSEANVDKWFNRYKTAIAEDKYNREKYVIELKLLIYELIRDKKER